MKVYITLSGPFMNNWHCSHSSSLSFSCSMSSSPFALGSVLLSGPSACSSVSSSSQHCERKQTYQYSALARTALPWEDELNLQEEQAWSLVQVIPLNNVPNSLQPHLHLSHRQEELRHLSLLRQMTLQRAHRKINPLAANAKLYSFHQSWHNHSHKQMKERKGKQRQGGICVSIHLGRLLMTMSVRCRRGGMSVWADENILLEVCCCCCWQTDQIQLDILLL